MASFRSQLSSRRKRERERDRDRKKVLSYTKQLQILGSSISPFPVSWFSCLAIRCECVYIRIVLCHALEYSSSSSFSSSSYSHFFDTSFCSLFLKWMTLFFYNYYYYYYNYGVCLFLSESCRRRLRCCSRCCCCVRRWGNARKCCMFNDDDVCCFDEGFICFLKLKNKRRGALKTYPCLRNRHDLDDLSRFFKKSSMKSSINCRLIAIFRKKVSNLWFSFQKSHKLEKNRWFYRDLLARLIVRLYRD